MFPEKLLAGYQNFLKNRFMNERKRYETLAEGLQSPEVMVIGCCDSRVSPEVIFDARPGELFVVRNVANLVPPHETNGAFHGTSAALEFAVEVLNVKHIVVLGHQRCGGIRAYAEKMAPLTSGDFIGKWINMIAPAADMLGDCSDAARRVCRKTRTCHYRPEPRQPHDFRHGAKTRRSRHLAPSRRLFRHRRRQVDGIGHAKPQVQAARRLIIVMPGLDPGIHHLYL